MGCCCSQPAIMSSSEYSLEQAGHPQEMVPPTAPAHRTPVPSSAPSLASHVVSSPKGKRRTPVAVTTGPGTSQDLMLHHDDREATPSSTRGPPRPYHQNLVLHKHSRDRAPVHNTAQHLGETPSPKSNAVPLGHMQTSQRYGDGRGHLSLSHSSVMVDMQNSPREGSELRLHEESRLREESDRRLHEESVRQLHEENRLRKESVRRLHEENQLRKENRLREESRGQHFYSEFQHMEAASELRNSPPMYLGARSPPSSGIHRAASLVSSTHPLAGPQFQPQPTSKIDHMSPTRHETRQFSPNLQSLLSNDFRYAVRRFPISHYYYSTILHRFRILVVGRVRVVKSDSPWTQLMHVSLQPQSGKSSLINAIFKVDMSVCT